MLLRQDSEEQAPKELAVVAASDQVVDPVIDALAWVAWPVRRHYLGRLRFLDFFDFFSVIFRSRYLLCPQWRMEYLFFLHT